MTDGGILRSRNRLPTRACRIGQTKAVQVIRLAAKGTIEEKMLKLQENKKNLADDIVRVNTDNIQKSF